MNERDYWLCWSYWAGRELGSGWPEIFERLPAHIRHTDNFREAYDRGVEDYADLEVDEFEERPTPKLDALMAESPPWDEQDK